MTWQWRMGINSYFLSRLILQRLHISIGRVWAGRRTMWAQHCETWWMTSWTPILCSNRIILLLKWIPYILIQ